MVEQSAFAGRDAFLTQPRHGVVEQRHGPAAFEQFIGGQIRCRLEAIAILGRIIVQRGDEAAGASFLSGGLAPLFRKKVVHRGQQKRAELPSVPIHRG